MAANAVARLLIGCHSIRNAAPAELFRVNVSDRLVLGGVSDDADVARLSTRPSRNMIRWTTQPRIHGSVTIFTLSASATAHKGLARTVSVALAAGFEEAV